MKKLMIAAVIGALSTTMLSVATDAAAQPATTTKPATKAVPKKPQPKRLIKRKPNPAKEAKVDPVPEGAEKWSCNEGLAFELKGGLAAGRTLLNSLKLARIAVSLGDPETLIQHPASMTHASYSAEDRERYGLSEGLLRLSVGLETPEDILADLRQGLGRL